MYYVSSRGQIADRVRDRFMPTFVFNWRSAMCVSGKGILCIVYWRRWLYGPVYRGEGWSEWSCRLSQIHRVTKTETERKPFGFYLISGSVVHRGIYMRYMARPPAPIPSVVSLCQPARGSPSLLRRPWMCVAQDLVHGPVSWPRLTDCRGYAAVVSTSISTTQDI